MFAEQRCVNVVFSGVKEKMRRVINNRRLS